MSARNQTFMLISHVAELGGAERVLLRLGVCLRDLDFGVTCASPQGPLFAAAKTSRLEVCEIPRLERKYNRSVWRHVKKCVEANRILIQLASPRCTVYVLNAPRALVYLAPTVLRNRRRVVCFAHDVYGRRALSRLLSVLAVGFGVRIICVSSAIARSLGRILERRVLVLRNPISGESFPGGRRPSRAVRLGTVSNIAEWKGHLFALQALEPILKSDADITYTVYGKVMDPAEMDYSSALRDRTANLPGASFAGYADEPTKAMLSLDVFVQSSTRSEQPLSLAEAIGAGCAVVVPSGGGEEEVVRSWPATFWYERCDIASLRDALSRAIASHRAQGVPVTQADYDEWCAGRDEASWANAFLEYTQ